MARICIPLAVAMIAGTVICTTPASATFYDQLALARQYCARGYRNACNDIPLLQAQAAWERQRWENQRQWEFQQWELRRQQDALRRQQEALFGPGFGSGGFPFVTERDHHHFDEGRHERHSDWDEHHEMHGGWHGHH
jgi:hypothetical protein